MADTRKAGYDRAALDDIEAEGLRLHAQLLAQARATVRTPTADIFLAEAAA